jgi:acyl-CoA synthetase (AMP-forming)/AMP-acid ligase II
VGTPVPGVRLELHSVDGFEAVEQGRVVVSSPAVANGYYPIADERLRAGVFASNDIGRLRGDELTLVGRIDDLINVRGTKVNPTEVERVILEMPVVEEVKVLGVPNEETGDQIVSAVVVARPETVSSEQIRAWCRERLSGFKIPRRFSFVEHIPRNDRGKLDRETLVRITEAMHPGRVNR